MFESFGNFVNCHDCGKRLRKEDAHEYQFPVKGKNDSPTVIFLCKKDYIAHYAERTGETAMKLDKVLKGE